MPKPRSKKFWIIFWALAFAFLAIFYFILNIQSRGIFGVSKKQLKSIAHFSDYIIRRDGKEKAFMLLFQNNMELRPGGGFIGSFGILKIKDRKITELSIYDLANFDARIPNGIKPPYPIEENLHINSWKLRDSNYSPDFAVNAQKAEEFYHLGQGQENFDGIIAINTGVLASFLEATGPLKISGYPGTYDSENAILALEYQVEKGYIEQGIEKGNRKSILNELAGAIIEKVSGMNSWQKIKLAKIILADLNSKDIQLYFKEEKLLEHARNAGWSGEIRKDWSRDYLMMVDANLGSYKSDYYIKRSFKYRIDLRGDVPRADLEITYNHTAVSKDWMTRDYVSYLRVYIPEGSSLLDERGLENPQFGEELGRKYFSTMVYVPLNNKKIIKISYNLPPLLKKKNAYNLLIEKQSGVENVPGKIYIIYPDGEEKTFDIELNNFWSLK